MPETPYRFFIHKDGTDAFRWRFLTAENRVMAVSGEGYMTRDDCEIAIGILCREATTGLTIEFDRDVA